MDRKAWMRGNSHIAIVLLICVIIRLFFFFLSQPWIPQNEIQRVLHDDALGYHQLAVTLVEDHRFASSNSAQPCAYRTPLYPMFIALFYSLVGYEPWVVILAQIALDCLSCFLLIIALSRLFDKGVALIAACFYAFDPFLILYSSTKLLSDTLFVFFLVGAYYSFSVAVKNIDSHTSYVNYGLSSLCLGLATLVKPIAQYTIACQIAMLLLIYRKYPKILVKYSFLSVVVFGLALLPWIIRNHKVFNVLSLSTCRSYNLIVLHVTPMEMMKRLEDSGTIRKSLFSEADSMIVGEGLNPNDLNEFQKAEYWEKIGIRYIKSDPISYGKTYLRGIIHSFFNLATNQWGESLGMRIAMIDLGNYRNTLELIEKFIREKGGRGVAIGLPILIYLIISYTGTLIGIVVSWRRYEKSFLIHNILFALYFVMLTGAGGISRYRMPAVPFYLSFSGIGIAFLIGRVRKIPPHSVE